MMHALQFDGCTVRLFEDEHFLETVFPDGTSAMAAPEDNDEYRATAERLGYGTDTWLQCLEHELGHTLVSQMMGLPYSPTLWATAHGRKYTKEMGAEEEMVLAYQRWRRVRGEQVLPWK